MDWLSRMNWPYLEDDEAKAIWEEARRLFFEEDEKLDVAFQNALSKHCFSVECSE